MIDRLKPYLWLAKLAVVAVSFIGGWMGHSWYTGSKTADDRISVAEAKTEKQAEQHAITDRVVTEYVDRIVYVKGKTNEIIKEVPVYIPADSTLPGGFRLLHDAAVRGGLPDTPSLTDARAVDTQTAARTIAENYGACHEVREQLTGLQEWVRQQKALQQGGVKSLEE